MNTYNLKSTSASANLPRRLPPSVLRRWQHIVHSAEGLSGEATTSTHQELWILRSDSGDLVAVRITPQIYRLQEILQQYNVQDANAVSAFLHFNPGVVNLLRKAAPILRQYFEDSRLVLNVAKDPEFEGASTLFVYIYTHLSPNKALEYLDRFDADWYSDSIDPSSGDLNFNLRFL